jgi:hypothetical protein
VFTLVLHVRVDGVGALCIHHQGVAGVVGVVDVLAVQRP